MSAAMAAALASILIPCGCVAWNMSLPQRTMKPFMEGVATSISSAFAVVSLVAGGSGAAPLLGTVGLLLSFPLLVLTFLSRLPSRRSTAAVGEAASDFELQDSAGVARRLSDYAGHWVVLKFYRGYWCPYCVRDLHEWEQMLDELAARNTKVVAVSPDRVDELLEFRCKTGFKMTLLADPDNQVIRRYNLQNRNFTPRRGPLRELVIPATLLIDGQGMVRWLDQASDFRIRRSAQEIMARIDVLLPGQSSRAKSERRIGSCIL